jgi:hypothetical protein
VNFFAESVHNTSISPSLYQEMFIRVFQDRKWLSVITLVMDTVSDLTNSPWQHLKPAAGDVARKALLW